LTILITWHSKQKGQKISKEIKRENPVLKKGEIGFSGRKRKNGNFRGLENLFISEAGLYLPSIPQTFGKD